MHLDNQCSILLNLLKKIDSPTKTSIRNWKQPRQIHRWDKERTRSRGLQSSTSSTPEDPPREHTYTKTRRKEIPGWRTPPRKLQINYTQYFGSQPWSRTHDPEIKSLVLCWLCGAVASCALAYLMQFVSDPTLCLTWSIVFCYRFINIILCSFNIVYMTLQWSDFINKEYTN